jgi:RimJ/RimL family protein N-acetyltransferase
LICEVLSNPKEIKSLVLKVSQLAFEDGVNADNWTPKAFGNNCWLAIKEEGEIFGLAAFRAIQAHTVEIHMYAMPNKCNKWKSIVKSVLEWLYSKENINKVIALVGVNHKTTYKLLKKIGFTQEGLIKESYLKDGKFHDQYVMGLTRKDIGRLI